MNKHSYLTIVLAMTCMAQSHTVFNESLDNFIIRMTKDRIEQEGFRAYYSNFLDRQSRLPTGRRQKRLRRLRMDGLSSLALKEKKQYQMLADFKETDIDNQSRNTRLFLVRYRLYEDYEQHKNTRHVYFLHKAKVAFNDVSNKISSFVSTVKHTVMS
ncbi:MAG: hypothetical protein ACJAZS_000724 [Alteromonas naphthalenivorans]|jgi:hypothetical protein